MSTRLNLSAFVLAGTLLLAGCDAQTPELRTGRVAVDVRALFRAPDGGQVDCASAADEVALTVTDEGGKTKTYRQALILDEPGRPALQTVRFDVEVEPGRADFAVAVWSTNRRLLYAGEAADEEVGEDFDVAIALVKQAPVLQVCPAPVVLTQIPGGFAGELLVYNRGNSPLAWQALPPSQPCNGQPCLNFDEDAAR